MWFWKLLNQIVLYKIRNATPSNFAFRMKGYKIFFFDSLYAATYFGLNTIAIL